ncbi:MAG: hypothetical protein FJ276_13280 [Planctomycetes bacterium]|nr:hypothetical protein [Planctomycetota bacterium]
MNEQPTESQVEETHAPKRAFRIGRVLCLVIPLAVICTATVLGWGYFDIPARINEWLLPPLVPVSGQVLLNDEPLVGAEIITRPENRKHRGALGVSDETGHFTLRTDVKGKFETGAYAGKHQVTVAKRDNSKAVGPAPLPLMTPPPYADPEKTPFQIEVERTPLDQIVLRLVGSVEKAEDGKAGARPMPPGPPGVTKAPPFGKRGPGNGKPSGKGKPTAPDETNVTPNDQAR